MPCLFTLFGAISIWSLEGKYPVSGWMQTTFERSNTPFHLFTRIQKPDVQSQRQVICPSSWSNESHLIPRIIVQNLNHEKSNSLFSYKMHRTIHEKYLGCGSVETSLYRVLNSSNHFLKGFWNWQYFSLFPGKEDIDIKRGTSLSSQDYLFINTRRRKAEQNEDFFHGNVQQVPQTRDALKKYPTVFFTYDLL